MDTEKTNQTNSQIYEENNDYGNKSPSLERKATETHTTSSPIISTPQSLKNTYMFLRELGHGAQAKVFLAVRLSDQKSVCIKQLNIHSIKAWKEYELFHREAETLSRISIPGVAKFYDSIECLEDDPPCSYIVQEFVEGASIAKMLKNSHRFNVTETYDILIQLLSILRELQNQNPPIIHRDIKPSNIMLSPNKNGGYHVTLIDFGAVANPQVQGGGSTVAGTFGYMPPEQLMGKPVASSDIYSLAAVAVELFTGKSPAILPNKDFRLIFEPEMEHMPPELISTLRQMLDPNAEKRLKDIDEIIQRFNGFKNNKFKKVENLQKDFLKEYNQRFRNVHYIGQDGNMDLWQELSDQTPRSIPQIVCDINIYRKALLTYFSKQENPVYSPKKILIIVLCIILLIFGVFGYYYYDEFFYNAFLVLFCSLFCFLFFLPIFKGFKSLIKDPRKGDTNKKQDYFLKDEIKRIKTILQEGRKSIATIVDIQYEPVKQINAPKRKNLLIAEDAPSFRIKYKFNPPDDSKEKELIHTYVTHVDPENHYQIGDPLPILYTLEKTYFEETIRSMPFPFPLPILSDLELIHSVHNYFHTDEVNTQLETVNYSYRKFIVPLIKNLDNKPKLIEAIKEMWHINTYPSQFQLLLSVLNNRILPMDDDNIHYEIFKSLLTCVGFIYNSSSFLNPYAFNLSNETDEISEFIGEYFTGNTDFIPRESDILPFVQNGVINSMCYVVRLPRNIRLKVFGSLNIEKCAPIHENIFKLLVNGLDNQTDYKKGCTGDEAHDIILEYFNHSSSIPPIFGSLFLGYSTKHTVNIDLWDAFCKRYPESFQPCLKEINKNHFLSINTFKPIHKDEDASFMYIALFNNSNTESVKADEISYIDMLKYYYLESSHDDIEVFAAFVDNTIDQFETHLTDLWDVLKEIYTKAHSPLKELVQNRASYYISSIYKDIKYRPGYDKKYKILKPYKEVFK